MNKDLRIEIRPIPGKGKIREFSEQLEYFSQAHILSPLVNPVTHKYVTGLNEKDIEYLKEKNFPYELDDTYIKDRPHPFWESSIVKVELLSSPMFLYPGKNLIDFVKYKFLLNSSYIYKSEVEMKTGSKPEATHYIYDESEENKIKAKKIVRRNNLLAKVSELSLTDKRKVIMILLNENTDNKDEDYLTVRFDDIVKNSDKAYELEVLLQKPTEEIDISATVKDGIHKNVLRRTSEGIFYYDLNLGFTEEEVVEKLMSVENQEMLLNIKEKIKN